MMADSVCIKILTSALAAGVISTEKSKLIEFLASQPEAVAIAPLLGSPKLVRELKLAKNNQNNRTAAVSLKFEGERVVYEGQIIGLVKILYKGTLPGELQARLASESAIDRFLEYLQKRHKITVLDESDRHTRLFIPSHLEKPDFRELWQNFLRDVAFSAYGDTSYQLPGLTQTFIAMLNTITLAGRGFSTLDVPILTDEQAAVLAAWYLAVVRDVGNRQKSRQRQIDELRQDLAATTLSDKECKSKEAELQSKEKMQAKEANNYQDYFTKSFGKILDEQEAIWESLHQCRQELTQPGLTKAQQKKLGNQQDKLGERVVFSPESVRQKRHLFNQANGNPFEFIRLDREQNPEKFREIAAIAEIFTKTATDQINSTRGDIFAKCILEMYRLLETEAREPLPAPLLTEQPAEMGMRSPGDDSKEFCYACGVALNPKTARWQVLRFMFERPSQRRQSSSSEGRPHICASCSALAFASPLKVTNESIILRMAPPPETKKTPDLWEAKRQKLKDYMRMLATKDMHLNAGRYLVLASDKTIGGDVAAKKLGQRQYALAKVASIFPIEVLSDFDFSLIVQGSQAIHLESRHLIFLKGLMEGCGQHIIVSGKSGQEINIHLGDAVRYIEQDLPVMAEYTIAKVASNFHQVKLEPARDAYCQSIQQDVKGLLAMGSENQTSKRATLYKDVAAITGLTYAFALSLEDIAKKAKGPEYAEREVSKLIESVDDAVDFCYYATLGNEEKTKVQARLYQNADNYFVYGQAKELLAKLDISDREKSEGGKTWLQFYADDVIKAYAYFAEKGYTSDKNWKELAYKLKLSLYTRFPEMVRKLKSTSEK
ncbi:MAG TPA: hypothetical protein IGS52_16890 [Oscillatoriaceae cyanobacterium M33_DOE_052]|uniref:Uncharacterized protein n=1 Tax=Planktothricoides sp. SpSt-374 TaxID=2282167 RepID=A0A7C3VTS2_9CYAN|nr:hypothetical protein [Oscillatoriaceae cyanobacterium M33_DOE_052]